MSENERLRETILLLERARADERVQRVQAERIVEALVRFTERGTPQQVYAGITRAFCDVLDAPHAVLIDIEPRGELPAVAATEPRFSSAAFRPGSAFQRTLSRGKPAAFFDATQVPEWREQPASVTDGVKSLLLVPLCGEGLSMLLLLLHGERAYFTADHVALARRLITPAVKAISYARSEEAERQLRMTVQEQRDQLRTESEGRARLEEELRQTREAILQREIEQKAALIEHQHAAIRELATPIIEVWAGILCLPVIGSLDAERSQQMSSALLSAVQQFKAGAVIIDITGTTQMGTGSVGHFLRIATAVRLLGARCVISGISATVAVQLIKTDVETSGLSTYPRVRDALYHLLKLPAR
jgi:anti-anti-sigma regulatory factor